MNINNIYIIITFYITSFDLKYLYYIFLYNKIYKIISMNKLNILQYLHFSPIMF